MGTITIRGHREPEGIHFVVEDDGIGMTTDRLKWLQDQLVENPRSTRRGRPRAEATGREMSINGRSFITARMRACVWRVRKEPERV